ncbi:hypothetical protein EMIHUDRAFT_453933 [Emiliania huxleyi CCMP1516]|uniref:NOT2/NOT3/NOT5 C-terminal domain-containing protein n=2 Tax=Emiliania huxleyi TaxID=2903 RepID=A0A0D3HZ11_EMIH1|nr:hypothetical protein EMIHUDRAFT_453933 [Emiliania huxleyi CCMP1516]EOD04246.1 hypothetical protein EMIHUDRAFT_453933 [Emiliania huxleyi CCMP1516]|eukprot:XP_005756675.1 hypothetical protein EMIHUDRAFT_453933 [Emiliania huxleyi CCMP1516]
MIKQGQGLGLPPANKGAAGLGMPGAPGLGHLSSGMAGPGIGLGMGPPPELASAMGGTGFDMSDFPSLGGRPAAANPALQQFRAAPPPAQSEFRAVEEDFPALGGAPAKRPAAVGSGGADFPPLGGGMGDEAAQSHALARDFGAPPGGEPASSAGSATDRFGLMGILSAIRMTEPDLNTLALGTDLTSLGLNLNSADSLYATARPRANLQEEAPAQREPEFTLPQCYYMQPPALKTGHPCLESPGSRGREIARDYARAYAATELYNRDWRHPPPKGESRHRDTPPARRQDGAVAILYHKDLTLWFTRASRQEGGGEAGQKGQYLGFDIHEWRKNKKYRLRRGCAHLS